MVSEGAMKRKKEGDNQRGGVGGERGKERGIPGQVVGVAWGTPVHLVMAPADIFPTAPRLSRIIARDYGEDQRDRLWAWADICH